MHDTYQVELGDFNYGILVVDWSLMTVSFHWQHSVLVMCLTSRMHSGHWHREGSRGRRSHPIF